jgi:hypothetical protein
MNGYIIPSSLQEAARVLNDYFEHNLYTFTYRPEDPANVERVSVSHRNPTTNYWELDGMWETIPSAISRLEITDSVMVAFGDTTLYFRCKSAQIQFIFNTPSKK